MRKKFGKRSGLVKLFPPLVMLSKCIDVGRAKRAQPKHHAGGYSASYKAAHRLFVHPLPHFTSTGPIVESPGADASLDSAAHTKNIIASEQTSLRFPAYPSAE
jgi:hypothetical protein